MMKATKQLFLLGMAVLLVIQASEARPWLSRSILSDESRLSSVQDQLRQNQLRRLRIVDDSDEVKQSIRVSAAPTIAVAVAV